MIDTGIRAIGPTGPTGPTGPFLASYVEAVGDAQTVEAGQNIVFGQSDPDAEIEIIGTDITVDATGTVFQLLQPGLYSVEWSANLITGTQPIIISLLENGEDLSAMTTTLSEGNISSGGLIYVSAADVPYTVSLHNVGGPIELGSLAATVEGGVVSIRIFKFADGPNV